MVKMNNCFWILIVTFILMVPWVLAQDSGSGVLVSSSQQGNSSSNLVGDPLQELDNGNSKELEHHQHSYSNSNPDTSSQASDSDDIISKSVNVIMQQITANMKLPSDQINEVRSIITDNITKVRDLQLRVEEGKINSKTMVDQRQQLMDDENQKLSEILTPDQMKAWINMQSD